MCHNPCVMLACGGPSPRSDGLITPLQETACEDRAVSPGEAHGDSMRCKPARENRAAPCICGLAACLADNLHQAGLICGGRWAAFRFWGYLPCPATPPQHQRLLLFAGCPRGEVPGQTNACPELPNADVSF